MFAASHKRACEELIKFASVGVLNTALGLIIIYSLKWSFNWGDASANLSGYLVCFLLGFFLNGRWTFGKSTLRVWHLLGYLLVFAIAYLMNLGAVFLFIIFLDESGDFAQLAGVPVFTLTSYLLNKMFVFSSGD